jgi:hypothetical protein
MALIVPDLREAVTLGGVNLNTLVQTAGTSIFVGSRVDFMEVSPPEVVQYTEKLPLEDGLDYGPLYKGGRTVTIRGVTFAATRGEAFDALSLIEAVATPVSAGYGIIALVFKVITGSAGTASSKTIQVRPNGISTPALRDMFGGDNVDAIGIPWAITAVALNPAIT